MNKKSDLATVLKNLEPLMRGFEFESAEFMLRTALAKWPDSAELNAYFGLVLCFTQREAEALVYLQRAQGGKLAKELGRHLVNHFHCRQLMAIKTGRPDPEGFQLLEDAQLLFGGQPNDVGVALTACLIVKNEEAVLDQCLTSIFGLVDEIVVVDTGSTDRTIEIAEKYGAVIGRFDWCDDFSAARNAALELATGRWALWIDADETLPEEFHDLIRQAIMRPQFAGYNIPIVNFMADEGTSEQYVHAPTRLFQMGPNTRFTGRIHEQISPSLLAMGLPFSTLDAARIYHEGYRPAVMQEKDKLNRALNLLEAEVRENPDDSFQWFNLANAFAIAGRLSEAAHACRSSIRTLKEGEPHALPLYQVLIETLEQDGRFEEALEAADQAVANRFGTIVTQYDRASVLFKMGRYDEALASIEACMKMEWPATQQGDYSVYTYKRHVLQGQILAVLERYKEALSSLNHALKENPACAPAKFSIASILERQGKHEQAMKAFIDLKTIPGLESLCLQGAARCCAALGNSAEAVALQEQAWRSNPKDLDAWIGWVQAAEASGDSSQVLAAYDGFVAEHEPSADLLINWGRALDESGDHEKALNCFTEALKREPENANAYFNCGDLLYRLRQYGDAAHIYESGLRHAPLNPQGWFVLGNALTQMSLPDGARIAYRQCLALNPNHREAQNNMEFLAEAFPQAG